MRLQAASGKGKSTLIHIIYGRRKDFTGKVFFEGTEVGNFSPSKWAEVRQQKFSIVFQELMLFPDLTGFENIFLKLKLTGYYEKEIIPEMAERLGAGRLLQKKCGIMSFGERQRIAIIRALMQPFEWLLLDEPFSHLDPGNSKLAAELIAEECKKRNAGALITALEQDDFFNYDETVIV